VARTADGTPAVVGYASTGLLVENLLVAARNRLPAGTVVGLRDGDRVLVPVERAGATATVPLDGRTWVVSVDSPAGPEPVLPLLLGASTLLFAGVAGGIAYREARLNRTAVLLARQVEQNAARTERLATVARALSAAEHLDDVVHIIEGDLPGVVAADVADIGLLQDGDRIDMLGRHSSVALSADLPAAEAVRESRPVLAPQPTGSVAAMPLVDADGSSIGVLELTWHSPVAFDAPTLAVLGTLSDLCGQTLQRAMTADRRHALILALQERMLPSPPIVEGLEIIARYRPAADAVGMGGDWYQFVPLPDGSLVVVLGDVTGHGVEAIATMTQIQSVVAAAVHTRVGLADIFSYVRHALLLPDPAFASALLLHLDTAQDRLGYTSAGHPYPLVRQPQGSTVVLSEAQQPLLGMGRGSAPLTYVDFPVGSSHLANTDGLIERRNRSISAGIEVLRVEFGHLDNDLEAGLDKLIANALRSAVAADAVDDDIAVVLVHRHGV
jgi:hypothetical protein